MSSFKTVPALNLLQAPSTRCSFQSPSFVRAMVLAMGERDYDAVRCGLDKALQLGLAARGGDAAPQSASSAPSGVAGDASGSAGGAQASSANALASSKRAKKILDAASALGDSEEVQPAGSGGRSGVPPALPLSCVLNSHPTLALYGDWLSFIDAQGFTTLQAQHCLLLLTELLAALANTDPDFDGDAMNSSSSASASATNPSPDASVLGQSPAQGVDGDAAATAATVPLCTTSTSSAPPESVIDTLTSFLARSCARRTVLVVDEAKVAEAAAAAREAAAAAAAAAEASPPPKDARGKRTQRANTVTSKDTAASAAAGGAGAAAKAMDAAAAASSLSPSGASPDALGTGSFAAAGAAAAALLVDPNPHVKEITVDPVFCAAEVQAICAFVAETVFLHWRLIAVLQRAPDGLTVPSHAALVVETLPVGGAPRTQEGTSLRQFNDAQARLQCLAAASAALQRCFDDAVAERAATIAPEYERATAVALRRDRVLRDDDMRKQMRPEEFKRTIQVLSRVMDPAVLLPQMAKAEAAAIAVAAPPSPPAASPTRALPTAAAAAPVVAAPPPPILTLEQRLERLEAAAQAHNHHHGASPAASRRRAH